MQSISAPLRVTPSPQQELPPLQPHSPVPGNVVTQSSPSPEHFPRGAPQILPPELALNTIIIVDTETVSVTESEPAQLQEEKMLLGYGTEEIAETNKREPSLSEPRVRQVSQRQTEMNEQDSVCCLRSFMVLKTLLFIGGILGLSLWPAFRRDG